MRKTLITLAACCLTIVATAQDNLSALMPMPNHVALPKGRPLQIVEGRTAVACPSDSLLFIAETVADILTHRTGLSVPVAASGKGGSIALSIVVSCSAVALWQRSTVEP